MAIKVEGGVVTMSVADYEKLEEDSMFLNCLRGAGVDNWDGYEVAQEAFQEYLEQ